MFYFAKKNYFWDNMSSANFSENRQGPKSTNIHVDSKKNSEQISTTCGYEKKEEIKAFQGIPSFIYLGDKFFF